MFYARTDHILVCENVIIYFWQDVCPGSLADRHNKMHNVYVNYWSPLNGCYLNDIYWGSFWCEKITLALWKCRGICFLSVDWIKQLPFSHIHVVTWGCTNCTWQEVVHFAQAKCHISYMCTTSFCQHFAFCYAGLQVPKTWGKRENISCFMNVKTTIWSESMLVRRENKACTVHLAGHEQNFGRKPSWAGCTENFWKLCFIHVQTTFWNEEGVYMRCGLFWPKDNLFCTSLFQML